MLAHSVKNKCKTSGMEIIGPFEIICKNFEKTEKKALWENYHPQWFRNETSTGDIT